MKKFKSFVKRGFDRCKGVVCALAVALGLATPAMAEGAATPYDLDIVSDISGKLEATLTSFWTNQKTVILTIVGLVVVFSLVWLVVKLWKRGTSKA